MRNYTTVYSKASAGSGAIFRTQSGIALLMVLWILTILTVMVFSYSYMARTETYAITAFRERIEKKFLAEAGIERGVAELFYLRSNKNKIMPREGDEVIRTDGRQYRFLTDNGYYTIGIMNEGGKVDINTAPELILKNLFMNLGLDQAHAEIIIDSIMDWKDPDNLNRLHGAEDDYYMSLPNPYKAKNADFNTVEELLLVKGITPDILYGAKGKKGIIDFLTVNSRMTTININAAPKEVLLAIPGITPELAVSILAIRETRDIQDMPGILGNNYSLASRYVDLTGANSFTIETSGYKGTEKSGYSIRATVTLEGDNKYKYNYYKTPLDTTS